MSSIEFHAVDDTINITARFAGTAQQLWQVFENPRKLEQWWGPPGWPATFSRHEFQPNGEARYHMTGPDGEEAHGWWQFGSITYPALEFTDGFSDADGVPDLSLPSNRTRVEVGGADGTATLRMVCSFDSESDLKRTLEMGMEEGITLALRQIEGLLDS